jgi:hypothetical protein
MFQEFLNNGLKVGEGKDAGQRRHFRGSRCSSEKSQQQGGLDQRKRDAAIKPNCEPGADPEG